MLRTAVLVSSMVVLSLSSFGCKRKELEKALRETQAKLADTEQQLDQEQKNNATLSEENQSYQTKIGELEAKISELQGQLDELGRQAGLTAQEIAELRKEREELRREKAKRERELALYKNIFSQLKSLVDAGTIKIEFRKGRMVIKLSDSILFDSGKTRLKEAGRQALSQLATALATVEGRDFIVAGHTDNVPIRTARFKNNWELSTARAVVVVDHLISSGMQPVHLGAAGFGEYDPVAANDDDEGRASNRRIEIILMPNIGNIPGVQELLLGNK